MSLMNTWMVQQNMGGTTTTSYKFNNSLTFAKNFGYVINP
jgi:hypothetical protein